MPWLNLSEDVANEFAMREGCLPVDASRRTEEGYGVWDPEGEAAAKTAWYREASKKPGFQEARRGTRLEEGRARNAKHREKINAYRREWYARKKAA